MFFQPPYVFASLIKSSSVGDKLLVNSNTHTHSHSRTLWKEQVQNNNNKKNPSGKIRQKHKIVKEI